MLESARIRTVTATVKDGRVSFNQVVMLQEPTQPPGVLLAGWEQDTGVYIWLRSQTEMEHNATPQHRGYSLAIGEFSVASPPAWLGEPILLSKDLFDPWENVEDLNTNAKRAAILAALNRVI